MRTRRLGLGAVRDYLDLVVGHGDAHEVKRAAELGRVELPVAVAIKEPGARTEGGRVTAQGGGRDEGGYFDEVQLRLRDLHLNFLVSACMKSSCGRLRTRASRVIHGARPRRGPPALGGGWGEGERRSCGSKRVGRS
jgi:hypothetical protein